jgi:hypothetical protein
MIGFLNLYGGLVGGSVDTQILDNTATFFSLQSFCSSLKMKEYIATKSIFIT